MVEYPVHTRYVICSSQIAATRPVGQAVKTPPFHGGNMGSIPVRVTMKRIPMSSTSGFFSYLVPVRESKRPTRRSRVKKCPVDTFLGRGRVEISKPPTIVREKPRQRQKGLGGHHEKPPYGNRRGAPGVNFGGQWPQPISHSSFLRIVTSLTRPVSAACPPNLLHIPFSLFPESARYCYRVEIDAKTQAPLAKGGWFCLWQNRGDSAGWQVSIWVCTLGKCLL